MSNERIDLTEDALRKRIREHEERYVGFNHKPTHEDVESILHAVTGLGLIAELKRMYEKEDENKPCDCEDPDYAYYWHDASGCFTVIHGAAECSGCGKAWEATQEGDWTIHFDRPTEDPYTG